MEESIKFTEYGEENTKSEFLLKDGVLEGKMIGHYGNGQLKEIINFRNGEMDGLGKFYMQNGNKKQWIMFRKGKINGRLINYKDNEIETVMTFKDDVLHGIMKSYYINRVLKLVCNYVNSYLEGEYCFFSEQGKLLNKAYYHQGQLNGENILYAPNGNIIKKELYKQGKLVEV